jgi:hypothetical protein
MAPRTRVRHAHSLFTQKIGRPLRGPAILGQGGMGLAYRACDTLVRREVAVKTILDIPDPAKRIKKHFIVGSGLPLAGRKFVFTFPAEIKSCSPASASTLS